MSLKKLFIAFVLFFTCGRLTAEEKIYTAFPAQEPMQTDGAAKEKFWAGADEASGFLIIGHHDKAEKQTSFRISYTEEALRFIIKCHEPMVAKLKSRPAEVIPLWEQDSVEIFIKPEGSDGYHQFIVNANGLTFHEGKNISKEFDDWKAEAVHGPDFYSVEVEIPFAILAAFPGKDGEQWRFNIGRNILTGPKKERCTAWPFLEKGFHDTLNYATLVFPKAITGQKVRKGFIASYAKQAEQVAKEAKWLEELLDEEKSIDGSMNFKTKLKELNKKLNEINALPLSEIKETVQNGKTLVGQTKLFYQEVRKKHLTENMFD